MRRKYTASLKVAARRFLRWNQKGQEVAGPRRGIWIKAQYDLDGNLASCAACKIGLVMIGRYGFKRLLSPIPMAALELSGKTVT